MKEIKAILAGRIFTPTEDIPDGIILIDGHRILAVGSREKVEIPKSAPVVDDRDRLVVPGFLDMHIHGAGGRDLMEGTPDAVAEVAQFLARHGITSFLATTVTARLDRTLSAVEGLAKIVAASERSLGGSEKAPGAQPLGIHFEGPFISQVRRGAQPASQIRKPSIETAARLLEAAGNSAKAAVLAPELPRALELLKFFRSRGLRVGLGHSDATFEETLRAIDAGATHATHCYNAMRPFTHREPGIIGAVLTDDRVCAELIADGVHVEPAAIRLLARSKGLERVILVSDAVSAAGMPDGKYRLGGFPVIVTGGICRTEEGTLAGSTATMDATVRNLAAFTGASFQSCVACATLNPARLLGIEKQKGVIAAGADADLVVLDKNHYVTQTYVRGHAVL
jgi:N-acetylglucosamine-6-phosphate deacetylase